MKMFCPLITVAVVLMGLGGNAQGVTIFQDAFESHSIGDQITTQVPPVGEWGSTITITPSAHTVQANPLGAGQVLRAVRLGTAGSPGFPTARTLTAPQADTIVTITWDTYRPDAGSGAAVQALYMGTTFVVDTTINPNQSTQFIRYNPGSGLVTTAVKTGFGGWERWEMVITWSAESGGLIYPTFDLFFERLDASNSEGILAQTQLADDVPTYVTGFTPGVGNMRWLYGLNAHFNNTTGNPVDSIVYFDNINITVEPVPEPASLALMGIGGLLWLRAGRRRQRG
ncbi:MAG: PEP-CTERM sorting domain-containing protein [Phycisphaeraceae bacterium]|nr:PEP-CTERM sorting domain-containing protein [Phycisphaeraceae bacterium]